MRGRWFVSPRKTVKYLQVSLPRAYGVWNLKEGKEEDRCLFRGGTLFRFIAAEDNGSIFSPVYLALLRAR